jgi:hypothetical protein
MTAKLHIDALEGRILTRLNAVRLFAVLLITFGYASTMPRGPEYAELLNLYGYDPSWFGIQTLFFMSGLMAMRSLEQGRTGLAYLKSRFWRNIPILAVLTVITLLILFPLFGTPNDQGFDFWMRITKYIALTVFCIDPGVQIQGLMDDAKYMCLVQGSIWTLRYGVILHILVSIVGKLKGRYLRNLVYVGATTSTGLYLVLNYWAAINNIEALALPLTALRLSYAFLIGMAVWNLRHKFTDWGQKVWIFPIVFFTVASINFLFTWSSLIDVALTLTWVSVFTIFLSRQAGLFDRLNNWTDITLPLLLINWPVAQTLLLLKAEWPLGIFILVSTTVSVLLSFTARQLWDQNIHRLSAKIRHSYS